MSQAMVAPFQGRVGGMQCGVDGSTVELGRLRIPFAEVTGFGVAVLDPSVRVGGVRLRSAGQRAMRLLYVGYRKPSGSKTHAAIPVGGDRGLSAEGAALVGAMRTRMANKWVGEGPSMQIRRQLGISNAPVVIGVISAIVVALIITAVIVVSALSNASGGHAATGSRSPATRGR